ncbi:MAG TPA: TonB-dependent receptor [Ohtaekwangia sp.]|nr:TonB-dependent receptor [Ohtaekwangia sp.]
MKTRLLAFLILITGSLAAAQSPSAGEKKGNGKISGTVLDAEGTTPVEYATVALMEKSADKPVDGAVCDDKGKFQIKNVADGQYRIVVSFIGYETKTIPITVDNTLREDIDLGDIKISAGTEVLQEVTVEGEKVLIEEKVDRTIYNAENDLTAKGGDATDVLKRVPMLSVDLDGNVSLRGNQNIQVLINNKPSTIMASNIADALKQIPADEIKSVEVITSPSAKYDAEGSAGIINIITKKNTLEGLTLNINTGVGLRGSNLGLNGNFRRGKMGFSLGGWGRANYNTPGKFSNEQRTILEQPDADPLEVLSIQKSESRNNGVFGNYNLGWDYDINPKNFMTASVRFGVRNSRRYQDDVSTERYEGDVLSFNSLTDIRNLDNSNNVDANITFTHLYEKPQHELSFQGQYSRNNRNSDFINDMISSTGPLNDYKNYNESNNQEATIQVDYQQPIQDNQMLELGAKNILRKVSSDLTVFRKEDGVFVRDDNRVSNNLNYDQNISAAYLAYTLTLKNGYSFKAGSRYEYTTIKAYTQTENNIEIPSYGLIVPSINISKKLQNGKTIKASYNRRIQRPSIRYLNPNYQQDDNLNVTIGNPRLDPEYTNNYELGYSTFVKGTSLNLTAFVRNTNDAIQSVRDVVGDSSAIRTTYRNIGKESAYGASIFASINVGKLSINTGGDVFYAELDNNSPDAIYRASNDGWVVNGRIFGSYRLNKGWAIQGFAFMRGTQVQLQGTQSGFRMYSLGIQKEFNEKRGSIGIGAENFATPPLKMRNELKSPIIDQKSVSTIYNMSFRVNFSYRIGKMSVDNAPRRSRRSISNDDLKEGGGDGMMEGAGGGQTPQRSGGGAPRRSSPQAINPSLPPADTAAVVNPEGNWTYTVESPQGGDGKLVIKKEGDQFNGSITNNRFNSETKLDTVTMNGNAITFSYTVSFGGNQMVVTVNGIINGAELDGTMSVGEFGSFPIKAKRGE